MKVVIFCGGFGTRYNLSHKKILKPLVKINGIEILKRIMNLYAKYGYKDFILLGGYKYKDLKNFSNKQKNFNITVLNTGLYTETATRLLKAKKFIKGNFFLTYGDSLTDFNPKSAIEKKNKSKNAYIMCIYKYLLPYGALEIDKKKVNSFNEKSSYTNINAGFYTLDESVFSFIGKKNESFEKVTIKKILKSKKHKLLYNYVKFWHPMDTIADKKNLSLVLKNKKI